MAWSAGELGGASVPKGIHLVSTLLDTTSVTNQSTLYTFTSVPFGPEHPSRELFVAVNLGVSNGTTAFTVSIGGVDITDKVAFSPGSHSYMSGRLAVPTGTSGTLVVKTTTGTATSAYVVVHVYRVVRKTTGNLLGSGNATQTNLSTTLTISSTTAYSGGVRVGICRSANTGVTFSSAGTPSDLVVSSTVSISGTANFASFFTDGTNKASNTTSSTLLTLSTAATCSGLIGSW